jgi:cell division protein YceG involved in septum cleavage
MQEDPACKRSTRLVERKNPEGWGLLPWDEEEEEQGRNEDEDEDEEKQIYDKAKEKEILHTANGILFPDQYGYGY